MAFNEAFQRVVLIEGGYSDHPHDSGGKTAYGITERVARAYGYQGAMQNLPLETARAIYKGQYWDAMRLDSVDTYSPEIADELFDSAANAGTHTAGKWLQRSLNVLNNRQSIYSDIGVDGMVGHLTVEALREYLSHRGRQGELVLLRALNGLQAEFYISLAERREKDEAFIYGWLSARVLIEDSRDKK